MRAIRHAREVDDPLAPLESSWGGAPGRRTLTQGITARTRLGRDHLTEIVRALPALGESEPEQERVPEEPVLIAHAARSFTRAHDALVEADDAVSRL